MTLLRVDAASAMPWGVPVLQDISLALDAGEITALIGPNGAGKSSLLRLIAGDFALSQGSINFDGQPLADWSRAQLATRLAFLPQLSLLNFPYTVEEVVLLGRTPHATGARVDREIALQALAATDTVTLRDRLYTQLSGGERQRVQLARVFAQIWEQHSHGGQLLLLDEPTAALDLAHQQQVAAAIAAIAGRGCAVLLVVHDVNLAAAVARRLVVLDHGRQVTTGSPAEVLTPTLFRELFHAEVLVQEHPHGGRPLVIGL
ncbi:heme ABC transporter ATP-binding protein [Kineobactrum sediminis]|uniref:Heme ABC transporter ATP-binding protein n=1 Tax=Kineobactrum sediminis TaxID=1905677 RepID=A0A2N5Y3V5_9GAMM|nr:heme ABC transporter ATP-binding protein [Kineobactrum sediminis]PLW83047.1 heme ABC transporter ATP-binding protein [Kineobactrum sediminis]